MNTFWKHGNIIIMRDHANTLYDFLHEGFEKSGFQIRRLRTDQLFLDRYNPLTYLKNDQDICNLTMCLRRRTRCLTMGSDHVYQGLYFLFNALIAFLYHYRPLCERNLSQVKDLLLAADMDENDSSIQSRLDLIFEELRARCPECFACQQYDAFRMSGYSVTKSTLLEAVYILREWSLETVREQTDTDTLHLDAKQKTIIFVDDFDFFDDPVESDYTNFLSELLENTITSLPN